MKASSVDLYDYVCIIAEFLCFHDGGKTKDDTELTSRGYSKETIELLQKKMKEPGVKQFKSCNVNYLVHPSNFKYDLFNYLLVLFENYKKGNLPFPGSVSEQPAQIMELFSLVETVKAEHELKAMKKAQNGRHVDKNKPRVGR